ncbi:MAG TPA: branched-chain amino acid ABC transporter ATP-binding protein/permease [Thermodesulforhabdus norvegica]|uniref:Branched-chain amino acid ABC transporter ATP-binding protein/permease n=1 Tax=Thermodesulforhabdus norvegica TaxID=39841 RepID=A0A7C0WUL7_9BACT|nr:branched-chain amino acid ABC transporter ATP-binding protein/permease [Deltaproteobacteria bacterium]MBW2067303.1 branched-chain amino acid ABC transporter ATP-binding protein/permease [Deltaproteobacteria bacterium]HDL89385.1 branched-chain amino acid ABC transporter ATP-binding protein/permease [Thermodesulforhabdus norvegica]
MRKLKISRLNAFLLALMTVSLAVCYFFLQNDYIFLVLNIIALQAIAVTGLNILIDATGQISIGHAAFYGIGAYTSALVTVHLGWPIWAGCLASLCLVFLMSIILAVPTLRLHGHYLVMATLGFNIIVSIVLNQWESLTGGPSGFPGIPQIASGDRNFFLISTSTLAIFVTMTLILMQSKTGKIFKAIRQNESAIAASGINVEMYKIFAFVLSSLYAGFAGFLYAHYMSFISPKTFNIFRSLQWVTMAVVGGMGHITGGLIGTAVLTALPEFLHKFDEWHVFFYGFLLIICLVFFPKGLAPTVSSVIKKWHCSKGVRPPTLKKVGGQENIGQITLLPGVVGHADKDDLPLRLERVSLNFGGLQILSCISLTFEPGTIYGLIGPNGAGKTSLFNIITGFVRPAEGKVLLGGHDITKLPPYKRARLGIARTFQTVQIFPELTVFEHLLIAAGEGNNSFQDMLLYFFELAHVRNTPAGEISFFERKLLEIARAVSGRPRYLLLDEPCAGLNEAEKNKIISCIRQLHRHGVTVVLVDHHMDVVMNVVDRTVVLHQGRILCEGSPHEVRNHPDVVKAYLGQETLRGKDLQC